jgi:AraC-like DNA-binding protein
MYAEWAPEPALAGRVACLWRRVGEREGTLLVVPDGCVDLIWGPDGPFVAGPDTGPVPSRVRPGDMLSGVRFRPGAAGEFFGVPLQDLRDQRIPLADLGAVPSLARALDVQDLDPEGLDPLPAMRAAVVARMRQIPDPDAAAPAILAGLRAGRSVREVAQELGLSERHLHRRTVAGFGYAPKTLQRVVRFQRALRLARSGVAAVDVAVAAGYTDQAHLSHDVKRLSGVTLRHLLHGG